MSFTKGLAKAEPVWLKTMQAPPALFPRADEIKQIALPEDVYVKKFFQKYLDSKHEDAIKIFGFDPPSAHFFSQRVLELKESGVSEEEAMAVADQIAKFQGKRPPPNPYPSAIKEIQAEERKYVWDRFHNPKIRKIIEKMKEEKAAEAQYRTGGGGY
ncbi:hypothetical protein ACJRO7_033911 [Eucalyptus globulus]|uniref:Small ribosomal subunit protein mS23 n=1 Tax=Eucalyptus globulus TaxID=34317 RepID=A0ABD3J218_EUCGL